MLEINGKRILGQKLTKYGCVYSNVYKMLYVLCNNFLPTMLSTTVDNFLLTYRDTYN